MLKVPEMAGLSLIGTYSSDSENEEGECGEISTKIDKRTESLPLPKSILTWKGVEHHEEVKDDPADHDGRTRSFKHERGNWATLIYTEYNPEEAVRSWMKSVSSDLPVQGKYLFQQFHLSLTRTLILKFHWIESFVDSVKELCRDTDRFFIELGDVRVYCNEDRTRTFLAIRCTAQDKALERLTEALDKLLAEYRLPQFYEDASFHVSFLWCHGDVEERLKPFIPSLTMTLQNLLQENSGCRVSIDELHCKIGNKITIFEGFTVLVKMFVTSASVTSQRASSRISHVITRAHHSNVKKFLKPSHPFPFTIPDYNCQKSSSGKFGMSSIDKRMAL